MFWVLPSTTWCILLATKLETLEQVEDRAEIRCTYGFVINENKKQIKVCVIIKYDFGYINYMNTQPHYLFLKSSGWFVFIF